MSKLPIHRAAMPKVADKLSRGLSSLPEVVVIRPYHGYPVGAKFRPTGVLRQVLLQQKYVEMADVKVDVTPKPEKRKKAKTNTDEAVDVVESTDEPTE